MFENLNKNTNFEEGSGGMVEVGRDGGGGSEPIENRYSVRKTHTRKKEKTITLAQKSGPTRCGGGSGKEGGTSPPKPMPFSKRKHPTGSGGNPARISGQGGGGGGVKGVSSITDRGCLG